MARTQGQLTEEESALLQSLVDLAVSAADEAIRKDSANSVANVSISGGVSFATGEVPTGLINGSNTTYTLANTPAVGSVKPFLNGIRQREGVANDYTISGDTLTFSDAPEEFDVLIADYRY